MERLETVKENRIASLETVALDQERLELTATRLIDSIEGGRSLIAGLSAAGAILAALAVQIHTSYPAASEVAGYAGAVALALVVVVRAQALHRGRVQAWVLADAASQSLQSEMYRYRTSSGPYSDHFGGNPEATLLERRDEILEKVRPIQKYVVEPDPKTVAPLGPLDVDTYISERVNGAMSWFRKWADHYASAQSFWQKSEYILAIVGALLAAALTFTHNLAYGAWVAVVATLSIAVGADVLAWRYAQLIVGYRTMQVRLINIVGRWRANHGTLDQLVEHVEATLLEQSQAWVAGADEFWADAASSPAKDSPPKPVLHSPASRTA
jgi:SMODS and SLOG-associating 2TM effector domain 1/SMODS and SLOG-associating 2TM effector domain 3